MSYGLRIALGVVITLVLLWQAGVVVTLITLLVVLALLWSWRPRDAGEPPP
jgi:accessory gene regulator protein AgrB